MAEIKHLSEKEFNKLVVDDKKFVLADFFATWCGPCKMLGPVLEQVDDELDCDVQIIKMDIDECESLAQEYGIMSVPTMILFKDGEEVDRAIGFRQKTQILEMIKTNMNN